MLLLELIKDPIYAAVVPVIATKVRVAVRGFDFKDAIAYFEHGNVEGAPTEIVHGDFLVLLLVQSVSQGSGGRLVNDAQDFQTSDAAGVFGSLALRIVEVSWNRDDRLGDFFAETHFGIGLELGQNHRRNFRRTELFRFAVHFDLHGGVAIGCADDLVRDPLDLFLDLVVLAAHEPLDGVNRIAGIGHRLAIGRLADQPFATLGESDDRRCGALAFRVFANDWLSVLHDGHTRVRRSQINSQNFSHKKPRSK